jgi:hypothetical protein
VIATVFPARLRTFFAAAKLEAVLPDTEMKNTSTPFAACGSLARWYGSAAMHDPLLA